MRRTVLDALLQQPIMFARVFGDGASPFKRWAYACVVPLAAPLVRKGNGITGTESIEDGHRAAAQALEFVAQRSIATGYLSGATFSVADLAAAAALAMFVKPANSPMSSPQPVASAFQALIERYTTHAGADWVRHIYAKHRASQRDFDGPSEAEK